VGAPEVEDAATGGEGVVLERLPAPGRMSACAAPTERGTSLSPLWGLRSLHVLTHGLRHGLHSYAASRLSRDVVVDFGPKIKLAW
jgi:hypothetical protein